ncbi:MAG: TetR/AcrR family transcriptional regulator, partial [Myxococcota bacterium]
LTTDRSVAILCAMHTDPGTPSSPSSREKILDVAEALFAAQGFAGVSLADVAARVGLGKSSLFHHFPGKVSLYAEVSERVIERIIQRLQPAFEASGPATERLDRMIEGLCDALAEHAPAARLLLRSLFEDHLFAPEDEPTLAPVEALVAKVTGLAAELLRDGIARGEFREVSVPDAVQTVIGAVVYHYASGEVGEKILGGPIFSAESVARRRREVTTFIHTALVASPAPGKA